MADNVLVCDNAPTPLKKDQKRKKGVKMVTFASKWMADNVLVCDNVPTPLKKIPKTQKSRQNDVGYINKVAQGGHL